MENTQIELIDKIVQKYRNGISMEDLSVDLGISVSTAHSSVTNIVNKLRDYGIDIQ